MSNLSGPSARIGLFIKPDKITAVRSDAMRITAWHSEEFDSILYSDRQLFASKINEILKQLASPKESLQIWHGVACQAPHTIRYSIPEVPALQQPSTALWHFQQNSHLDMTKMLFDYEIHEKSTEKNKNMQVVSGIILPRQTESDLQQIFKYTDFKLFGLTPFWQSWYNVFKKQNLHNSSKCTAFLYTGLHGSTLQIFKNGEEILSRQIKIGISRFYDIYAKYSSGDTSDNDFHRVMSDLSLADKQVFNQGGSLINEVKPVLNSLWQKLELTLDVLAKQKGESVDAIYICGNLTDYSFFETFLNERLPERTTLKLLKLPNKSISRKANFPESPDNDLLDAASLSLCDNSSTRNFLFPCAQKVSFQNFLLKMKVSRICLIILSICALSYWFIYESHISTLERNFASNTSNVERLGKILEDKKLPSTDELKAKVDKLSSAGKKTAILKALDEIIASIPRQVKITKLELANEDVEKEEVGALISGIITGEEENHEFLLGSFMRKLNNLKNSAVTPNVSKNSMQLNQQKVLSFNIEASFYRDVEAK